MKRVMGFLSASALVISGAQAQVDFSHDFGTTGQPGSAVNFSPNVGEVFNADGVSNILLGDLASLGLVAGDNLDALSRDGLGNSISGVLEYPFLFSVEPGAVGEAPYPVWSQVPFNAADVYAINQNVTGHVLAYDESVLGLASVFAESIDSVTDPQIVDGVRIYLSLQQGSPTLLNNAWSGADILTVVVGAPGTLERAIRATDMGLIPEDEVDGFVIYGRMDANGNAIFDHTADYAQVYFSVDELSVGEIGTEIRNRYQTSSFHGGDIYRTGLSGGHQLHYEADGLIRLGAGDVLDALKQGSLDPLDPFPMYRAGGPNPSDEPQKPPHCPPYRGIGVPIGCIWIEICDTPLPDEVNWSVTIKMCKADGTEMEITATDNIKGLGNGNPDAKADEIAKIFGALKFPKPGEDPDEIPLFKQVTKSVPPQNVMGNNITGEVCMFVNQDVIDCGWNIDAICFSFTNWTASIIPKPVKGWFPDPVRDISMLVEGISEHEGLVRITSRDDFGVDGTEMVFVATVEPGVPGSVTLPAIAEQINETGGLASVDADGWLHIEHLGAEPPVGEDGSSGPLVIEMGALAVPSLAITQQAKLSRGPLSPCSAVDYAKPFGELNFFDVSAFLAAYMEQSGEADLAYDGVLNFFDVSVFLQLYAQGCSGGDVDG
jgi:hypothetical protein